MAPGVKQLNCSDYYVAWICPLADVELLPARLMLDEQHLPPLYDTHYDENTYICGAINDHKVVIATCPQGETGNVNCGRLTGSMFKTFPNITMAILVGIGGGIPRLDVSEDPLINIHLGDVVVGYPGDGRPACVYYDRGKSKVNGHSEILGTMKDPDWRLGSALTMLKSDHELDQTTFNDQIARLQDDKVKNKFAHPGLEHDRLFKATYHHTGNYGSGCTICDPEELVQRPQRSGNDRLIFHLGRIATGNRVIQDGALRDEIGARCNGALCIEMEAAGVDVNRQCLVVRGISDYADSHKNDIWKSYAAGNAAAFTRELLCRTPTSGRPLKAYGTTSEILVPSQSPSSQSPSSNGALALQAPNSPSETITKVPKSGTQWSPAEDKRLLRVAQGMPSPKWKLVAQHFHRDEWACRQRYEKLMRRQNNP
jgi:nucleoside phosphorylase